MVACDSYLVRDAAICAQRSKGGPLKFWVKIPDLSVGLMLDIPIDAGQIERVVSDIELETFDSHPGLESYRFAADVLLSAGDYAEYMAAANSEPCQ